MPWPSPPPVPDDDHDHRRPDGAGARPRQAAGSLGRRPPGRHRGPELFGLAALDLHGPACVVLDRVEEHHPEAEHGILLRGPGVASPGACGVEVRVEPERVTWWRGGGRDVAAARASSHTRWGSGP